MIFHGYPATDPDPAPRPGDGNRLVPGRTVNSQIAGSTMQDTQYNINHAGIKGYENTRMQNERNRGHRIQDRGNPPQPGGPSKEGPADLMSFSPSPGNNNFLTVPTKTFA